MSGINFLAVVAYGRDPIASKVSCPRDAPVAVCNVKLPVWLARLAKRPTLALLVFSNSPLKATARTYK
jgi:hypothetical protein